MSEYGSLAYFEQFDCDFTAFALEVLVSLRQSSVVQFELDDSPDALQSLKQIIEVVMRQRGHVVSLGYNPGVIKSKDDVEEELERIAGPYIIFLERSRDRVPVIEM